MTIELQGPRAKLSGGMDTIVPSPEFYNITNNGDDHTLPGNDVAAYAASPNSLYMYEQEKHDMQNTISGSLCSPSTSNYSQSKEEFDLKPQYELSSLNISDLSANQDSLCNRWIKSENIFDSDMSSDAIYSMDNSQNGPTLAELNMDESLIDEVVSLVNADSGFTTSTNSVSASACPQVSVPQTANLKQHMSKFSSNTLPQIHPSLSTSTWPTRKVAQVAPLTNVSQSIHPVQSPIVSTNCSSVPTRHMAGFPQSDKTTLHKLLLKKSVIPQVFSQTPSNIVQPVIGTKRSATVAKLEDDNDVEEKWNEIKKYIHEPTDDTTSSTSSQNKRSRHDSKSSTITSTEDQADSDIDVFSDRDSDLDDDLSDEEGTLSQLSPLDETLPGGGKKKDKQYFWQYNVQSKGPKGTRLKLELDSSNPHELKHFEDPVFDPTNTQVAGIRHGGKARKGDGNDVHPNPKRLVQIGMQIKRLNRKINEVTSLGESNAMARNQSRKEKNKLASRACRLKKKAQHEANKVKLFGLETEHRQLMEVMVAVRAGLKKHVLEQGETTTHESLVDKLEELIKTHLKEMIGGNTTDYVNKVIANYEKGDPTGGLAIRRK